MERPEGAVDFVIPYPGKAIAAEGWIAWLRRPLTPEREAIVDRECAAVFPWLALIFFTWLFTYDWAATVAILKSTGFWRNVAIQALYELLL